MNRVFSLLMVIPIYFLITWFLLFSITLNNEVMSLEQFKLVKALNYATDAATNEMIGGGHLGMDYSDVNRMTVDPGVALDTFCDVFALSYDLPMGMVTREYIQNMYLPIFVVAGYDGYYVFERHPSFEPYVEGNNLGLISTPKLPYSYRDTAGNYYALNLSWKNAIRFHEGALSRVNLSEVSPTLSINDVKMHINNRVSDDLMWRVDKLYEQGIISTFYIPYKMATVYNTNAIEGPTVFAYINEFNINTRYKLDEFSVGGTEVEEQRMIAAYVDGSLGRLYAFADLLPASFELSKIENMYATPMEAAKAGYYHDVRYMNY
jgi:hypothetical protein